MDCLRLRTFRGKCHCRSGAQTAGQQLNRPRRLFLGQARFMPGLMCAMRARQKGNVEGLKRGNGANARAESASILDATVSTAPTFVSRKMFIQLIYWPSGLV
jgi:hypothetical protein